MKTRRLFALFSIVFSKRKPSLYKRASLISLIIMTLTMVAMIKVGYEGGKIRHSEIYINYDQNNAESSDEGSED